jgi:amino acid transporter
VGSLLGALPLLVWLRYSEDIVSAGGIAAFVESAVGRPLALAQAAVWSFSYFLYLPYTVTDVVYEIVSDVFPGTQPWRPVFEVLLPLAIVGLVFAGARAAVGVLAVSAAIQVAVVLVLGLVILRHVGAPTHSFTSFHAPASMGRIGLLFVCGSLPLFLGAEVAGGGRTLRRSIAGAWALVAAYAVFAAFGLAAVPGSLRSDDLPGVAIAQAYVGRGFAVVVGLGIALSLAGLIVAEYLALSRLVHHVTHVPVRRAVLWIGIPFVGGDLLSLISPGRFDELLTKPSLVALYLSLGCATAVFPLHRARRGKLTAVDVAIALGAPALFAFGLYQALFGRVAT